MCKIANTKVAKTGSKFKTWKGVTCNVWWLNLICSSLGFLGFIW